MTGTGVILIVLSLLGIAIAAQLSIGGRRRVLYTTAFLFSAGFWPTVVSTQSIPAGLKEPRLLREEIRRHVIDECDLYSLYKKNRNEFDPIEVGVNILPEIFKTKRREIKYTTNQIYQVVKNQGSFYKRALIYNIYYKICLGEMDTAEAIHIVPEIMEIEIPNEVIRGADSIINTWYGTYSNDERAERDRKKIEVLTFIESKDSDVLVKKKLQSVIQELRYDIELWES